jgi:YD repeat-containing protein
VVSFEYDLVGRVTKQILPDLREINMTYDANGNVKKGSSLFLTT